MRAWGLAKGLRENGIETTVAVNDSFPQTLTSYEDVIILNWSVDDNFRQLINSFDMGKDFNYSDRASKEDRGRLKDVKTPDRYKGLLD